MDTYVYEIDNNLYINLTNKCSNSCTFCVRNGHEAYFGNKLWLKKEPSAQDVLQAIDYDKKYNQVVFCGFGEPTERADVLVEIARELKKRGYVTRINTNGQGNLINSRDITQDLAGCIDYINVSLNACSAAEYQKICRSRFGEKAFFRWWISSAKRRWRSAAASRRRTICPCACVNTLQITEIKKNRAKRI